MDNLNVFPCGKLLIFCFLTFIQLTTITMFFISLSSLLFLFYFLILSWSVVFVLCHCNAADANRDAEAAVATGHGAELIIHTQSLLSLVFFNRYYLKRIVFIIVA